MPLAGQVETSSPHIAFGTAQPPRPTYDRQPRAVLRYLSGDIGLRLHDEGYTRIRKRFPRQGTMMGSVAFGWL